MRPAWHIRESDPRLAELLSRELGLHPLVAALLTQRGVGAIEEASRFLAPALSDLQQPGLMKGMDRAVVRLVQALQAGERVCIFGDYDVDGVTSVCVLRLFLRELGLHTDFFIPSRTVDGYGLNRRAVERIAAAGVRLLVTVDCGISDVEEVRRAREAGMDVLVIDHHQVPAELPEAVAVLDPHQPGCLFPGKDLAAVGVTFNLVMALRARLREQGFFKERREPNLREYLDLVALGTIADVVPLLDQNRIIARFGLTELSTGRRPGVAALKEAAGMLSAEVAVGQVAFRLAPRINAAGRMGDASRAVELFCTDSYSRALVLARELEQANCERQKVEAGILRQAREAAQQALERGENALVLASEEWHPGVIGIVASRLVEQFERPAVLIALQGDEGRGSARGREPIHLYRALAECAPVLQGFGGHRAAAGLSIRRERIDEFRRAFIRAVVEQSAGAEAQRRIYVDGEVPPSAWDRQTLEQLRALAPHGPGNPEPLFVGRNLMVRSPRLVGREASRHLKLTVVEGQQTWEAIGFGLGERIGQVRERMNLVYTPGLNSWEGRVSVQLRVQDFTPA